MKVWVDQAILEAIIKTTCVISKVGSIPLTFGHNLKKTLLHHDYLHFEQEKSTVGEMSVVCNSVNGDTRCTSYEDLGEFPNVKQLLWQRFDAYVNKSLNK
jgi:hypothetical protein